MKRSTNRPVAFAATAAFLALAAATAMDAFAQTMPTPVGVWKTVDDSTQKEKSLIRITEAGGVLSGKIEKLLDPATSPDITCKECSDDRKDKPVLGMTVIRNVKQNADDKAVWDGGDILDPNNGKVYKVKLKPIENGAKLEVRGYIGFSLLGRTQTWVRSE